MSGWHDIDVLVVGLGPAGASAAAAAAAAGARVLAVDRNARPGLPVQCAEFVPMLLGAEVRQAAAASVQPIDRMATHVAGEAADLEPDFTGRMIDRARFDAALVDEAKAAGAEIRLGTPLRTLDADGIARLGDGTAVRARVIVGADGPRSVVGRAIGRVNRQIVETRQITADLRIAHRGTDIFLDREIVGGYGWLFPKGGVCNIGVGVAATEKHRLKPLLARLHARLVEEGRVGETVHGHTGGAIPVGGMVGPTGRIGPVPVLLAGDAAGLTNPVTGAGINAAVNSGRLAGEAAAAIWAGERGAAPDYGDEIEALFGRSLALARRRRGQLMAAWRRADGPTPAELRDGWIAYPQYWADAAPPRQGARMTA